MYMYIHLCICVLGITSNHVGKVSYTRLPKPLYDMVFAY